MDTLEILLPEVHPASVRRVRGRKHPAFGVGEGVLPIAEGEGEEPSSGGARASLQVDQDHLEVLADTDAV